VRVVDKNIVAEINERVENQYSNRLKTATKTDGHVKQDKMKRVKPESEKLLQNRMRIPQVKLSTFGVSII
jgi:hypothetical protein